MSASNAFETAALALVFNATTWANVAINATSSPFTNLYVAFHTSDPGEAGTQATNECAYGSYARVAVARTSGGWVITANSVSPASTISFPTATSGSETITHASIGGGASGATAILVSGTVTPNIVVAAGVTPQLTTASAITLD